LYINDFTAIKPVRFVVGVQGFVLYLISGCEKDTELSYTNSSRGTYSSSVT